MGKHSGTAIQGHLGRTRALLLLWLVAVLSACSDDVPPPLRVGTNLWVGYEPLYLARALHAYPHNSVHLVELSNTTDVLYALRNDTLEAAALTLDEALSERAAGLDLKVLLVMDYSSGGDALIARPYVQDLPGLRGMKVGYEESAVGAVMLDAVLAAAQLKPADIHLVPITPDQHLKLLQQGEIDALVSYEPFSTALQQQGNRLLFDSRSIPGRIIDVLAVCSDVLAQRPKQVEALVGGWFQALKALRADPKQAIDTMRVRHQLGHEAFATSLAGLRFATREENHQLLAGPDCTLRDTAEQLAALMVQSRLLAAPPPLEGLCHEVGGVQ